jgi:hypothetical protein
MHDGAARATPAAGPGPGGKLSDGTDHPSHDDDHYY